MTEHLLIFPATPASSFTRGTKQFIIFLEKAAGTCPQGPRYSLCLASPATIRRSLGIFFDPTQIPCLLKDVFCMLPEVPETRERGNLSQEPQRWLNRDSPCHSRGSCPLPSRQRTRVFGIMEGRSLAILLKVRIIGKVFHSWWWRNYVFLTQSYKVRTSPVDRIGQGSSVEGILAWSMSHTYRLYGVRTTFLSRVSSMSECPATTVTAIKAALRKL